MVLIDFYKRVIRIYASKTMTWHIISICDEKSLIICLNGRIWLFFLYVAKYNGKQEKKLKKSFNRSVEMAWLSYTVRVYDVRYLFATMLLSSVVTIGEDSALLGNSRTGITLNVYHHTPKHKTVTAIEKLTAL